MIKSMFARSIAALFVIMSFQAASYAQAADLSKTLSDKLGVSGEQATGGAGAIFKYAKDNLDTNDFATIAKGIPGMDGLLAAAPEPDNGSALGQAAGMLGGTGGSLGGLASLTSSFESLGLSPDMASKFVPIVSDYVGSASGDQAMALLKGLF